MREMKGVNDFQAPNAANSWNLASVWIENDHKGWKSNGKRGTWTSNWFRLRNDDKIGSKFARRWQFPIEWCWNCSEIDNNRSRIGLKFRSDRQGNFPPIRLISNDGKFNDRKGKRETCVQFASNRTTDVSISLSLCVWKPIGSHWIVQQIDWNGIGWFFFLILNLQCNVAVIINGTIVELVWTGLTNSSVKNGEIVHLFLSLSLSNKKRS